MAKTAPIATFEKFWDSLVKMEQSAIPPRITAENFKSYKAPFMWTLVTAYQFFRFIDENNEPTSRLRIFLRDKHHQNEHLRKFVYEEYSLIFSQNIMDLDKNTLYRILNEHYNLNNDAAIKKGMSFFKQICVKVGIKLSEKLSDRSGITAKPIGQEVEEKSELQPTLKLEEEPKKDIEPTSTPETETKIMDIPKIEPERRDTIGKTVREITLKSGGRLSLTFFDIDLLELNKSDRDFVYSLSDSMREYGDE